MPSLEDGRWCVIVKSEEGMISEISSATGSIRASLVPHSELDHIIDFCPCDYNGMSN
jgi:hypothetical protein